VRSVPFVFRRLAHSFYTKLNRPGGIPSGATSLSTVVFWLSTCGLLHPFVGLDLAVADVDDAVGVRGDVVLVGDQEDGVALLVQPA
jgi:hypothetical protein